VATAAIWPLIYRIRYPRRRAGLSTKLQISSRLQLQRALPDGASIGPMA
jgi:hypothetical protein